MAGERVKIISQKVDEKYINICRYHGQTLRWEVHKPHVQATAWIEGNTLMLRGSIDGQPVSWEKPLQDRIWKQPLSYALRNVARGNVQEERFLCLRPDTLEPVEMQARRMGIDEVCIEGQTLSAVHVRIRLDGFLSMLWHGDYWFRTTDHVLLRYTGVNGPPGTAKTVIDLMGEDLCWKTCLCTLKTQ